MIHIASQHVNSSAAGKHSKILDRTQTAHSHSLPCEAQEAGKHKIQLRMQSADLPLCGCPPLIQQRETAQLCQKQCLKLLGSGCV
eukprot:4542-Heterococcus_DN1.PRE.4